jgi:hypothetical protein
MDGHCRHPGATAQWYVRCSLELPVEALQLMHFPPGGPGNPGPGSWTNRIDADDCKSREHIQSTGSGKFEWGPTSNMFQMHTGTVTTQHGT